MTMTTHLALHTSTRPHAYIAIIFMADIHTICCTLSSSSGWCKIIHGHIQIRSTTFLGHFELLTRPGIEVDIRKGVCLPTFNRTKKTKQTMSMFSNVQYPHHQIIARLNSKIMDKSANQVTQDHVSRWRSSYRSQLSRYTLHRDLECSWVPAQAHPQSKCDHETSLPASRRNSATKDVSTHLGQLEPSKQHMGWAHPLCQGFHHRQFQDWLHLYKKDHGCMSVLV